MSIQNGKDFKWVYERYLAWFHQNAKPTAAPKDEEGLLRFSLCHENVFEQDVVFLNQLFFAVPLLPSVSLPGQFRLFVFSDMNLMKKIPEIDDFDDITPVEYAVI